MADVTRYPVSTASNGATTAVPIRDVSLPAASVAIDLPQVTQRGAIEAALGLCPRECFRLHIARCPVCTHLESARREIR